MSEFVVNEMQEDTEGTPALPCEDTEPSAQDLQNEGPDSTAQFDPVNAPHSANPMSPETVMTDPRVTDGPVEERVAPPSASCEDSIDAAPPMPKKTNFGGYDHSHSQTVIAH